MPFSDEGRSGGPRLSVFAAAFPGGRDIGRPGQDHPIWRPRARPGRARRASRPINRFPKALPAGTEQKG